MNLRSIKPLAITLGEPAGVSPEIILKALQYPHPPCAIIGDIGLLRKTADRLGLDTRFAEYSGTYTDLEHTPVVHLPYPGKVEPGRLNVENAESVVTTINLAVDGCLEGEFSAMVTAPVHKGIINDAGIPFTGHTEWIADRCQAPLPVMMLASETMKVCLATTHLPLSKVSDAITRDGLAELITIMDHDIANLYNLSKPRIGVCGLNPHAGESGHLGTEEIEVIAPTIEALKQQGINLQGPLPADTAFTKRQLNQLDAILAMYHDQGLPVIKHSDFGDVVNVTLGLPIIRTSVDHGTALDIAGKGTADATSLVSAIQLAHRYCQ